MSSPTTPVTTVARAKTNILAILALITAFPAGIVGVILGFIALRQIRASAQPGRGLAIAGIVVGVVNTAAVIVITVMVCVALASMGETSFGTP